MKKYILALIALPIFVLLFYVIHSLIVLSPLDTITYNEDYSELYYNGHTYIEYVNTSGKYNTDPQEDADYWVKIATMPYFFPLAITEYYGNDLNDPDVITTVRAHRFYVRKDIVIDQHSMLSVCDAPEVFRFRISDVITENLVAFDLEAEKQCKEACNFQAAFEAYPGVTLDITISVLDGKFYLQDNFLSDYYEITEDFHQELLRLGYLYD